MKLKVFKFVIVFVFYFSFSLLSFANAPYGGKLVLYSTSDPKSFNPVVAKETSTTTITSYIFEGLTTTNGVTLEIEPHLADSWQVSEDGLTWTFYLRRDVKWFDGASFTSDDVVFTYNKLIYNKEILTSSRDIFTIAGKEIKVVKVDDYTVNFVLPFKFAPFLRSMGNEILPKHLLDDVVSKGDFNSHWGLGVKPQDVVGTGMFILESYIPGERVILKRNPNYWKKDAQGNRYPYLDKIVYLIVKNEDVAFLKFQDGELDYYSLRGQDYPILKPQEESGDFNIYNAGAAFGTNFLVFNQNRDLNPKTKEPYLDPVKQKWFTDKKFRQAVAYAIDKQSIIDIAMNGLGYVQTSSMSPSSGFFYNPNVIEYDYDIDRAKRLLKEIGVYDRDNDGVAEDGAGNPIKFNLFTNTGNTVRIEIAKLIRSDLESLGFEVSFVPLAFNQIGSKLDATYDWDAIILGLTGGIEPHFGNNVWQSGGQLHMWYPRQKSPVTSWEREINDIFDKAVQELDKNRRKQYYDRWQEIVAEEVPLIYTVLPASIFAVRKKLVNLNPTPYGGPFHNLEEIYIKDN